ncbi:MAG TPA: sodium:solute symporter [Vicinamibacterales bacterium]|nr:sodium:solute symporter [Vicinamibacterales bacterium]
MSLSGVDYLVIGVYLLAITAYGSWFARYQKTTRDYFLTDRSVPWWAICFTIVATETSTLTFIGIPAQAYAGNMTFLQLAVGYIIGRVLVSMLFIPAYFRGELFTSYELLQRRFGTRVKTLSAVIFLMTRSLADGIRLFTTALVIAIVTQVPVTMVVIVLGAAMIVYTMRGGVSAVIWTDVIQMFVYIAGAGAVAMALLGRIDGGWAEVVRVGSETGRFVFIDTAFDFTRAYTIWAGLLGGVALTLSTHGTDQYLVQRLLSAKSQRAASTGLILSGFIVFAQFILFLLIGTMLYVHYQQVPLPQVLARNDQILPIFVVSELQNGLAGFIVAAIVAAALSPSLNAMAATTVSDFYLPYVNPSADQATQMRVSKQATVAWGVVQLAVAIGAQFMNRSVLDAGLAVLSFASGSVLGAFLLGTLVPSVRERDTFAGMIAGLIVMSAVWWATPIAFTWYVLIGAVTTCAVALVSRALGGRPR